MLLGLVRLTSELELKSNYRDSDKYGKYKHRHAGSRFSPPQKKGLKPQPVFITERAAQGKKMPGSGITKTDTIVF